MPPPSGGRGGFRGGKGKPRTAAGFKPRGGSTRGESSERPERGGFKKSYDRPAGPGGFKKSFSGSGFKKTYAGDEGGGLKSRFGGFKKDAPRGDGPPGAFRKSYDRPEGGGFKKSFGPGGAAGGGFKKSYDRGGAEGGGFKKSFGRGGAEGGGFKKSSDRGGSDGGAPGAFKKSYDRGGAEGGERKGGYTKSYEGGARKSFGFKKPFDRAAGGDGPPGAFKKSYDRPAGGGFSKGGDRPAFAKKGVEEGAERGGERIKRYDPPGARKRDVPRGAPAPTGNAEATAPAAVAAPNDGRWVWGINPVLETLRAHPEQVERIYIVDGLLGSSAAAEILSRSRDANLKVDNVERERLTSMIGGGVHQGVVAEVREYQYKELEDLLELAEESGRPPLIVVLDGIQDPHNLGAIIRSAHSFGAHGVVVARDRAAGVTGIVAKSSAGAIEHCPVARVVNIGRALEQLKEAGCWTVAADPEGDQPAWGAKLDGPLAIVVGSEGPGVREGVLSKCDFKVLIPMIGRVESLNASVSAGVLLYEVSRQRAAVTVKPPARSAPEA